MAQKSTLLDFLGHSVICTKASTRVPTQITCKFLNSTLAASAQVMSLATRQTFRTVGCSSALLRPTNHSSILRTSTLRLSLTSEGGRIIAMSFNSSTFFFAGSFALCSALQFAAARGAQYSDEFRFVNNLFFATFTACFALRLRLQGARSIALRSALSTICHFYFSGARQRPEVAPRPRMRPRCPLAVIT
jgi:hypothetical protein